MGNLNKIEMINERLQIISEHSADEYIVGLSMDSSEIATVTWQPQYGKAFPMYAKIDDNGVFYYGTNPDELEDDSWFRISEDIDSDWDANTTRLVKYGTLNEGR